jgi:predicted nucleic acid-binding protein
MAVPALVNAARNPTRATAYRRANADDPILVSFMTITELRFGALRAGWGELRRRGLERAWPSSSSSNPTTADPDLRRAS